MKIVKIFSFIACFVVLFTACETDVVDPAGARGEGVVPLIANLNPATFDVNDLQNTFIQFDLLLDAPSVSEAVLVASYKGGKQRAEIQRLSSFPVNVTVTLADACSKLGISLDDIEAADVFDFEVQTIQGGKTYYSSAAFKAAVVCGYDVENVTGSYHVISEDWDMEGDVTITADPDDPYTLYVTGQAAAEGLDEDGGPLVLKVNPLNFSVSAPKVLLATSLAPFGLPYNDYSYQGSGELNTCDGSIQMLYTITVDAGSFGSFNFSYTKN